MPMPYKGARMRAYTRVHPDILAAAQRNADDRKIGLSDWIAEAMTEKVKRVQAQTKRTAAA